ncbi:auxin-responsive family protein [Raphanus sativus]|uniref:Auxin-induced in root cultures protein 12 n=1 Tax=Raphanus sativus TaxID=3726 RepID=A0A6J0K012_RAPSA|nr:auxin-induced in root cultures protein 12 [Raphanus sativus]XP_056845708.1 auxin-induced in root cultures protein 12-like [Raphanus sativus]KAJ4886012.1 auxin-responsive family protein [Raphanus sativus]KAJ4886014.1 auxin-responsive family protein [Raphanus sativus]
MAPHSSLLFILAVACFSSLISPATSQTCSTQNVLSAEKTPFQTCLDLPELESYLHYTYNATNSSLSVAFVATPSRSDGWIAWAINPAATTMSGSQAFLAYGSGPGAPPVVKTYNISGYNLTEGRLAFDFWNLRAESLHGGRIAIFATVKVPAGAGSVNQVWQVGGNVTNGRVGVHPFSPPNLNSRAVLNLTGTTGAGGGGSKTPGNAGWMTTNVNFGVNLGVLVLLGTIFIF